MRDVTRIEAEFAAYRAAAEAKIAELEAALKVYRSAVDAVDVEPLPGDIDPEAVPVERAKRARKGN